MRKIILIAMVLAFSVPAYAYSAFVNLEINEITCSGCTGDITGFDAVSKEEGFGLFYEFDGTSCVNPVYSEQGPSSIDTGDSYTILVDTLIPDYVYYLCLSLTPHYTANLPQCPDYGDNSIGNLNDACQTEAGPTDCAANYLALHNATCSQTTNPEKAKVSAGDITFVFPFYT